MNSEGLFICWVHLFFRRLFVLLLNFYLDHGVPKSTKVMKDLVRELEIQKKEWKKPILVHCRYVAPSSYLPFSQCTATNYFFSAGIGRTGTFVAIHMCLNKDLHGEEWTVFDVVKHLRDQRLGMSYSCFCLKEATQRVKKKGEETKY